MGRSGARSTDVQASGAGLTASRTGDSHVNSKVNSAAKANHQSNPTVGRMDVGSKASRHIGSSCSLSHCPALEYRKIRDIHSARPCGKLFVYDLDLLVEHFPGKPVDRYVHPVTLLTFHNGTYKTRSVGRIAAAQGYHVNQ